MKLIDKLLVRALAHRMAQSKGPGDPGWRVYAGILSAIGAELVRRTRMHGDFSPQVFANEVSRMKVHLAAVTQFSDLDVRSEIHQ
jgi:hypothetical protein